MTKIEKLDLKKKIQYVKGVGQKRAELLHRLGIFTLEDLLTYYPKEHEDRSKEVSISQLQEGKEALIEAVVVSPLSEIRTSRRNMTIYKLVVRDETGSCVITFFNQSYLKGRFKVGQSYRFFGKVKMARREN